jgi:transcriptional regulator with XRE-family HTH domain
MAREPREIFEDNLRREAAAKGFSLVFVANRAGLTSDRLLAIFSGEYDPDLEVLTRIATAVGSRLSVLFREDEDPRLVN